MADDDIFMDYAASSPVEVETEKASELKCNIPKIGSTFDDLLKERHNISLNLKNHLCNSGNLHETRFKILQLRRFNRHLSNRITDHRKQLSELKDNVDNLNSKLLCQKFEKQHLLDEIKSCLSSKNIYASIDLESIEGEANVSHELMIKRLQEELSMRNELQNRLVSILKRKQKTEAELETKKRKIEDLRGHLQNLLKNSKPLAEVCGYDLEAFYKKKMAVDDVTVSEASTSIEDLSSIYEKLVTFVADKADYKLRYFDPSVPEKDEEDLEMNGVEEGRNSSIKSAYIQIKMEISNEIEPVDIFLKLKQEDKNVSCLLLSIHHEMIPENSVASWLKSLGTIEFDSLESSNWSAPSNIQPDSLNFVQDSEAYEQVFNAIKEALQVRSQLLALVQANEQVLEFDKNNLNEVICSKSLKAQISMNSIVWIGTNGMNDELISNLNAIGTKYRSVLDCLQAQLELLLRK